MSDKSKVQDVAQLLDQAAQDAPTITRERKPNATWSADLMARCATFAAALCKSAVGAQPGRKPFAVYLKRDTGKPNLPQRSDAEAIIGCTVYHLRQRGEKSIVLQAVQLPEEGYGVFARKAGSKRRKVYASDVTF